MILDNVSSHHSAQVAAWHAHEQNHRVRFHPIPTYSAWLNLVEVFFNLLQRKVARRGNFHSRQELVEATLAYNRKFSSEHRIFRWTKPVPVLLRKLNYVTGHSRQPSRPTVRATDPGTRLNPCVSRPGH